MNEDTTPPDVRDRRRAPSRRGRAASRSRARRERSCGASRGCPFVHKWVAVMPDVHSGSGATVGSVVADARRDHPGRGRRRHRLRHDGGARRRSTASDLPDDLQAMRTRDRERPCRTAAPNGGARTTAARGATRPSASQTAWAELAAAATRRIVDEAPEARARRTTLDAPRHARHRQPLHRGLPRRARPRVVHAALRLARRRQPHRQLLHRAREEGHEARGSSTCPTRTSRTSPRAREHFDDYVAARRAGRRSYARDEPRS